MIKPSGNLIEALKALLMLAGVFAAFFAHIYLSRITPYGR